MILQNLVFNKLGNSFSMMIEYQDRTVQIWDDVKFSDRFNIEIIGICIDEPNGFYISFRLDEKTFKVFFNDTGFKIENYQFFLNSERFYLKTEKPEILFKISMADTRYLMINKENIEIPEKNFFKALGEFLFLTM